MANKPRGETVLNVEGIGDVILVMTLGSMAQLEDDFGVDNIEAVSKVLSENPSTRNIATMVCALANGHDGQSYKVDDVRRWPIVLAELNIAFAAAMGGGAAAGGNAQPPLLAAVSP